MKIHVKKSICSGHGLCAQVAVEVYRLDDDGYCENDGSVVPKNLESKARQGAQVCPEGAITLTDL